MNINKDDDLLVIVKKEGIYLSLLLVRGVQRNVGFR